MLDVNLLLRSASLLEVASKILMRRIATTAGRLSNDKRVKAQE